jgi:predicted DNA binding protein
MEFQVSNPLIEWRGPAPFYFVAIDEADSKIIKSVAKEYSYGWGVIYVTVTAGKTTWTTAVIPKDGRYLIPMKDAIRSAIKVELGDVAKMKVKLGKNG